jgi:GntR family transcriptional regulator
MLPFAVSFKPGESPYRQVVYAATKAIMAGELAEGTPFPSVRELSTSLKINPNTAHKAISELVRTGLLAVLPGVGTVVSAPTNASPRERRALLSIEVEQLVVEAKRLGLTAHDVLAAVESRWLELFGDDRASVAAAGSRTVRKSLRK